MISLGQIQTYFPSHLHVFKRNMLREYLQYKILECIYSTTEGHSLIFMGGTALRIIHQHSRFSEDLDFDNRGLTPMELDSLSRKIGISLTQQGYQVEIHSLHKNAYHCKIKIPHLLQQEGLSNLKEEKILIQLDAEPQHASYTPASVLLNRFDVLTRVHVVPIETLLSQKLYAAFRRKRVMGRDFYDILFLWPKTSPDYAYLEQKLGISTQSGLKVYLIEQAQSVDFEALSQDLHPFVFYPDESKKVSFFPEWIQTL